METILAAENIKRSYSIGKTTLDVLKGVSLDIKVGETVSIMGESGSGKSTLLHVLGGLDTPKTGTVRFQGKSIYGMSSVRRARFRAENVGLVFQAFHLLPELDIVENVALQELSGGEQQRVAIARSLMNEPDIVFADEPTGNLDSRTGEKVLHYLFQLVEARRHTLVLVTHSHQVASRCSRTLHLKDGVLI